MTCPEGDIVTAMMRILQEVDPQRPVVELRRFERQMRDKWGGQRVYIKKPETVARKQATSKR